MCGITGIIGQSASVEHLKIMLNPIKHRGEPGYRDSIFVLDQKLALGMHRLAIVKEDVGQQPVFNCDQTVYCVFNGEIYNYQELSEQLKSLGSKSPMLSEAQVILAAYLYWGVEFVKKLDGKFAIAIVDLNTKNTILVRDYMGVKPLYYQQKKDKILFSSELKSFENKLLDKIDKTDQILSLKPGHYLSYGVQYRYLDRPQLNLSSHMNDDFDLVSSQLRNYLEQAVKKRITTDPVACLLSGGIDSSIITYIMSKYNNRVSAYTLGLDNSSDVSYSRLLCKKLGVKHIILAPKKEEMQNFYLKNGVYMTESYEPTLVRNAVSYHTVCKAIAADGFKYALTGEGADELFGGYDFIMNASGVNRDILTQYSLDVISNTYLQMADRAAMYASLEARVPYMDKDLVNFTTKLSSNHRISQGVNKVLLRKAYANSLPVEICNRKKLGMSHGGGLGVNDTAQSIYYEAVEQYYNNSTGKLDKDQSIVNQYKHEFNIDVSNLEEVYNFARYVEYGYTRYSDRDRYQLNGPLKPTILKNIVDS